MMQLLGVGVVSPASVTMPSRFPSICFFGDRRLCSPPCLLLLLMLLVVLATTSSRCVVEARRNVITHIKGFRGPLPFHLETGYVEVDEEHGVRLFYYFIESERKPAEDPLILWITGGPGCSALSGLLFEIGPHKFDVAGYTEGFPQLFYFKDAWTKVSNIIFLDAPVGTGFSYAREEAGYNITLTGLGRRLHTFLRKWLAEHEEFASNPFYIGGDSYSGFIHYRKPEHCRASPVVTVPVAAVDIANNNGNGQGIRRRLNLKGYLVGNPATDEVYDKGGKVPFMHGMGLISDELYEEALQGCGADFYDMPQHSNTRCTNALNAIDLVTSDINPVHVLEPFCGKALRVRDPGVVNMFRGHGAAGSGRRSMLVRDDVERPDFFSRRKLDIPVECRDNGYRLSYIWADDREVRVALGIHNGSIGSWSRCRDLTHFTTDIDTVIPHHVNLTKAGYRALVYNGDHDLDMTFVGTQAWIRSLKFPIVSDWRPWHSNGQVAGFTRTYAYNLTYATVKGAGHTAPEYKPKECLDMLNRWMSPTGQL